MTGASGNIGQGIATRLAEAGATVIAHYHRSEAAANALIADLGRVGTPNDVADAVLFLLSPAARWIGGASLVADGGMSTLGKC